MLMSARIALWSCCLSYGLLTVHAMAEPFTQAQALLDYHKPKATSDINISGGYTYHSASSHVADLGLNISIPLINTSPATDYSKLLKILTNWHTSRQNQLLLNIAQINNNLAELNAKDAQKQLNLGRINIFELKKQQLAFSNTQLDLQQAQNLLNASVWPTADFAWQALAYPDANLVQQAELWKQRADVRLANTQLQQAQTPNVLLAASYNAFSASINQDALLNMAYNYNYIGTPNNLKISVSASLNLSAFSQIDALQQDLQQLSGQAQQDIILQYQNISFLSQKINLAQENLDNQQFYANAQQDRYRQGIISLVQRLQADKETLQARLAVYQDQQDLDVSILNLYQSLGLPYTGQPVSPVGGSL